MKYKTILADPPWQYGNKRLGCGGRGGASHHYPTMTTDLICDLEIISEITGNDSVLFLWATVPMWPDALLAMDSWGYKYKTQLIWVKTRGLGMGFWFRVQYELCLVGTRGKPKPFRQSFPNIFFAPITKHSRKPEKFFQLIDPIIPRPAIELFAREKREGWDAWGDEAVSDISIKADTKCI